MTALSPDAPLPLAAKAAIPAIHLSPDQISVNLYRFGDRGPEPVIVTPLPFDPAESDGDFHFRVAARYMTAIGHCEATQEPSVYRLPVLGHPYFGLVYPFRIADPHCDARYAGCTQSILVVFLPKSYEVAVPPTFLLARSLQGILDGFTDISQISALDVQDIHGAIYAIMEEYYAVLLQDFIWQRVQIGSPRPPLMNRSPRIPLNSVEALSLAIKRYEKR